MLDIDWTQLDTHTHINAYTILVHECESDIVAL